MSRVLGVLGGMGPAATVEFLAKLQAATPAARDQDHIRVIADINPRVPDRNDSPAHSAAVLSEMAVNLRRAGAEVLAMPCNTAHVHAAAIEAASGLRLVHMIDEAVAAAGLAGARSIGLLATVGAADLYEPRLAAAGRAAVRLGGADREAFMAAIYQIKAGGRGEAVRAEMARLALALARAGAEAVIVGCTEVPLVLSGADPRIPLVDAGRVLARRCVAVCMEAPAPDADQDLRDPRDLASLALSRRARH